MGFELPLPVVYVCPGETHPITRSVHLARLAAFYPKCRDCEHRHDTGQIAPRTVERLQSTERRVARPSLFTTEGVRGVYLNELTRGRAAEIAAAFASLLWEAAPLTGRVAAEQKRRSASTLPPTGAPRTGPTVVIAFDERPSSPDIITGVATALRRMGCAVIDLGLATKPCFRFTVDHLQATAGIFVTGAGCDPAWTGLDFVGRNAAPYSMGTGLEKIEAHFNGGVQRAVRHAGPQRTFQAMVPYEAGLWKHFHALRPLSVCCACPTQIVPRILERLFAKLPCKLHRLPLPQRTRDLSSPDDPDVLRLGDAVVAGRHHLGMLIDDGQRCAFVDEQGDLVSARDLLAVLCEMLLTEERGGRIAVESAAVSAMQSLLESLGGECLDGGSTQGQLAASAQTEFLCGGGDSGRFWFRESFPTCDAIITLGKVLQALSRSDAPFSAVVLHAAML